MINKHGLPMQGLRNAAGDTKSTRGYYGGYYVEIVYDRSDGTIWTVPFVDRNSYARLSDTEIAVCLADNPMTMQEIADAIKMAVDERDDFDA